MTTLALVGGTTVAAPSWAAGSVDLAVADLTAAASASGGAFSVSGPSGSDDVTITGDVELTGVAASGRTVTISGGTVQAPRKVTLRDVSVAAGSTGGAAIQLAAGAHVDFTLSGSSTLTGSATFPGLGIPVGAGAAIAAASTANRLDVTGSGNAAAIGGDGNAVLTEPAYKPVTISGLTAAGCGSLAISGGTVNATVAGTTDTGAAIGGGRFGSGCTVAISGGIVNASARAGAGIGGGIGKDGANGYSKDSPGGAGGDVSISGGTVTATSVGMEITGETGMRYSAPIGGGRGGGGGAEDQGSNGAHGTLSVTGGSVKLSPRPSDMAPEPKSGEDLLGQVKVPSAAGVSSVVVTPQGGSAIPFSVSANHPSDDALYLLLPYPKSYSIAVTANGTTTTYAATLTLTGSDVVASAVTPASLAAAPVTIPSASWGYTPAATAVKVTNSGGMAATITGASVTPSDTFTITKPATVTVPAKGNDSSITVQPVAGLPVGTYQGTATLTYGTGSSVAVPLSFAVTGSPEVHLSALVFPPVIVGTAAPSAQDLVITNGGSAPATLTSVTSSDASFSVENSTATVQPGGSVTVKVQPASGLGVGTHQATITAAYSGGATATAQVSLTVNPVPAPPPPPAPSVATVRAGQSVVTLVKGSSITVPAVAYLANGGTTGLTWTSSASAVASVAANGSIKALAPGKTTISASAGDKVARVTVTVLAKKTKTKVKSVSASVPKSMKLGARVFVTAKFSPTTTPGAKITFSSSKKSVLTVDAVGTLVAMKKGKATISVKAGGKTKKYSVSVK